MRLVYSSISASIASSWSGGHPHRFAILHTGRLGWRAVHTATLSTPQTQTARALLALRELLLRGEFRPGTRLTELGLVSKLSASRTPVRHALTRLAHEGLLDA